MPCARFTPPSWSTTRVISRMTDSVKPWTRREICIRWGAATGPPSPPRSGTPPLSRGVPRHRYRNAAPCSRDDDVALDRIDLDALVLEPLHAALEGPLVRLELERYPAVIGLHVGPADVDHDVEVLHEPVHDRLLDERRREGQADTHAGHREHRPELASRDRGQDRHLVAVLQRRLLGLEEADVLLVDVDIDEAAQLPRLVEQAVLQTRVLALEVADQAVDRLALALDLGAALRQGAQRGGNPYQHRHVTFLLRRVGLEIGQRAVEGRQRRLDLHVRVQAILQRVRRLEAVAGDADHDRLVTRNDAALDQLLGRRDGHAAGGLREDALGARQEQHALDDLLVGRVLAGTARFLGHLVRVIAVGRVADGQRLRDRVGAHRHERVRVVLDHGDDGPAAERLRRVHPGLHVVDEAERLELLDRLPDLGDQGAARARDDDVSRGLPPELLDDLEAVALRSFG